MRKELGGTGTPFGYTDPDLYTFGLDNIYDTTLQYSQEPSEAATVLLALQMSDEQVQASQQEKHT